MPWNGKNNGDGWKSGGRGPWGDDGGKGPGQPDLEELIKKSQERLKNALPGGRGSRIKRPGGAGSFLPMALFLMLALAFIAWKTLFITVDQNQIGVVTQFGKYDRQLEPGLHLKWPYPIEQAYLLKPNEPKNIDIGYNNASRGRFGRRGVTVTTDSDKEALMLTGDNKIAKVQFGVQWRIKDPIKYLFNIQSPADTVKDVAESAMREVVGRNKLDFVLSERFSENKTQVLQLMQKILDDYKTGIEINLVNFSKADVPDEVRKSFLDVIQAQKEADAAINTANAYSKEVRAKVEGIKTKIVNDAKAYKAQMVKEAEGEAQRFNELYQAYKAAPEITRKRLYLETMERVLSGTDKIILDGGSKGNNPVVPYLPLNELTKPKAAPKAAAGQ